MIIPENTPFAVTAVVCSRWFIRRTTGAIVEKTVAHTRISIYRWIKKEFLHRFFIRGAILLFSPPSLSCSAPFRIFLSQYDRYTAFFTLHDDGRAFTRERRRVAPQVLQGRTTQAILCTLPFSSYTFVPFLRLRCICLGKKCRWREHSNVGGWYAGRDRRKCATCARQGRREAGRGGREC